MQKARGKVQGLPAEHASGYAGRSRVKLRPVPPLRSQALGKPTGRPCCSLLDSNYSLSRMQCKLFNSKSSSWNVSLDKWSLQDESRSANNLPSLRRKSARSSTRQYSKQSQGFLQPDQRIWNIHEIKEFLSLLIQINTQQILLLTITYNQVCQKTSRPTRPD